MFVTKALRNLLTNTIFDSNHHENGIIEIILIIPQFGLIDSCADDQFKAGGCLKIYALAKFHHYFSGGRRLFKIIFKTDTDELTYKDAMSNMDEQAAAPGGIIGFQLMYWQEPCSGAIVR